MSTQLSLWDRLRAIFRGVPDTQQTPTRWSPMGEGSAIAASMSADKMHRILRAAEAGEMGELFDLYRDIISSDAHLQAEFSKRKLAVLADVISVQPARKNNADDDRAATMVQEMIDAIPDRIRVLSHLLDSVLYPVAAVEKIFRPSTRQDLVYELDRLIPVRHRLLDFRAGDIRLYDVDSQGSPLGTSHPMEAKSFIFHRGHILTTPDTWGGPMRSLLFWWLLSAMDVSWWARFLEKYGQPFLIGKYDSADQRSRDVLRAAFSLSQKLGGLVITKETAVEVVNAISSQSTDSYDRFLAICQREKSKLILGQTTSAEAQPTGLGSGVANAQAGVRDDLRRADGIMLAATLRDGLVVPFMRFNGLTGPAPKIVIGGEDGEDLKGTADVLSTLSTAGVQIADAGIPILSQRLGYPLERRPATSALPFSAMRAFAAATPKDAAAPAGSPEDNAIAAGWQIAGASAADVAQLYGRARERVGELIMASSSPADLEKRMQEIFADWPTELVATLYQDALAANVLNGATPHK